MEFRSELELQVVDSGTALAGQTFTLGRFETVPGITSEQFADHPNAKELCRRHCVIAITCLLICPLTEIAGLEGQFCAIGLSCDGPDCASYLHFDSKGAQPLLTALQSAHHCNVLSLLLQPFLLLVLVLLHLRF